MSLTTGFCVLCNSEVDADLDAHFAQAHPVPVGKPRVQILSVPHRIDGIMQGLGQVKVSDPKDQVVQLDELLKEMYVLRATIYQRAKAGN